MLRVQGVWVYRGRVLALLPVETWRLQLLTPTPVCPKQLTIESRPRQGHRPRPRLAKVGAGPAPTKPAELSCFCRRRVALPGSAAIPTGACLAVVAVQVRARPATAVSDLSWHGCIAGSLLWIADKVARTSSGATREAAA